MRSSSARNQAPVLFIPHGGGPLPLLGDPGHGALVSFLGRIRQKLGAPKAILLISAHREQGKPTLTGGSHPDLIYDYIGFPPESYEIEYPAPGLRILAERTKEFLEASGIESIIDERRVLPSEGRAPAAVARVRRRRRQRASRSRFQRRSHGKTGFSFSLGFVNMTADYAIEQRLAIYLESSWSGYLFEKQCPGDDRSDYPDPLRDKPPPRFFRSAVELARRWTDAAGVDIPFGNRHCGTRRAGALLRPGCQAPAATSLWP